MQNLEIAKRVLREKNLSLVIVKNGKVIFKSRLHGVVGLIQAIEVLGKSLLSSSVADRVVGRAAALLLIYSHIGEVYAITISALGLNILNEYGIKVEYDILVPKIMNRRGDDLCPLEKISLTVNSPREAYEKLKEHASSIRGFI